MSNNYFISCPNSEEEEEEESEIDFSPKKKSNKENIKSTRKILHKMKSGTLPKVLSRNLIEPSCNIFKEEMKIDYESEKDSFESKEDENYINNDNLLLYDDDDFIQYKKEEKDDEDKKEEKDDKKNKEEKDGKPNVRSNRINSCSILDVLKNRFSFDESI